VGEITSEQLNKMLEDRKFRSLVKTTTKYLKSNPKAYPLMVYQAIALANLGKPRKAASTFGKSVCDGSTEITSESIRSFRERYLSRLAEGYRGIDFVTDKIPSNFRFIALRRGLYPRLRLFTRLETLLPFSDQITADISHHLV
jgi:hypothetical protein